MGNKRVNNEGLHNSAIDVYIRRVDIRLLVQARKFICSRVQIVPKMKKKPNFWKYTQKGVKKKRNSYPKTNQKILKVLKLPRFIFFKGPVWGAYIQRGLSTEGNLRFKIDWTSLIIGSKYTVFALFYFVFEGNFPSTSPRGTHIWRGDLTEFFRVTSLGGLFSEFFRYMEIERDICWKIYRWSMFLAFCVVIKVTVSIPYVRKASPMKSSTGFLEVHP